jgi:DHA3 family tetracycline resistance protein-like MFS transporter
VLLNSKFSSKHDAYHVYLRFAGGWRFATALAFTVNMVYLVVVMRLNAFEMVLVGTALELGALLFEIPTGILADRTSRKLSLITGSALSGISFLVFIVPSFIVILLSQVLFGLGWTFISGAQNAWLTDEIGEDKAGNAFMRGEQVAQVASAFGIIISIALALVDLRLAIVACGLVMLMLALYLVVFMPETNFSPQKSQPDTDAPMTILTTAREGLRLITGRPVLLTLMLAIFVWGAFSEGYDRMWTLHLIENFSLPELGENGVVLWFGVIALLGMPISLVMNEVVRRRINLQDARALARTLMWASGGLVIALLVFAITDVFWLALLMVWVIGAMRALTYPLREAWLNQGLPSRIRATVLSMGGQMDAIGQIAGGPAIGWLGLQAGVRIALMTSALILMPILWLYQRTIRQGQLAQSP